MRRLVRPPKSTFKVGQRVSVDGDAAGDYVGTVIQTHGRLTKHVDAFTDDVDTRPGVSVRVDWWDGSPVDYPMEIDAWDSETTLRDEV